jgi:hypothetical protein
MFGRDSEEDARYTKKVSAPIYEPKNKKPHILNLCNDGKTRSLISEINQSDLSSDEKRFLTLAAQRHNVFHYERIADYYAQSSPQMQRLMEKSALVIIDFDKAIEEGFVKLCDEIRNQYLEEVMDEK